MLSRKFTTAAAWLLGGLSVAAAAITPAHALETRTFVSANGDDNNACTITAPCKSWHGALLKTMPAGEIDALDAGGFGTVTITQSVSLYAGPSPAGVQTFGTDGITINVGPGDVVNLRGLVFNGMNNSLSGVRIYGSGRVNITDCIIQAMGNTGGGYAGINITNAANVLLTLSDSKIIGNVYGGGIYVEPNGGNNQIAIRNTVIANNQYGVLVSPNSGATVTATLDRVTITQNGGPGLRTDTTSGSGTVTLDVSDSTISNNGNGINVVAGASQNIVSIEHTVIARNGGMGIQANGVNAGVLAANTLFDQNAAGATSVVNGGNMFTYGNNRIVGGTGSGFTGSAALQ